MLYFAVVDDQLLDRKHMKECIDYLGEITGDTISVDFYDNPTTFLVSYKPDYDVILMDIEMPEMNGIDVVRKIREVDKMVSVLFITNMAQFVFQGYEVNAVDYIVKPIDKFGFVLKMKRVLSLREGLNKDAIIINKDGVINKFETRSIKYFEVQGHYVIIHALDGNKTFYSTLKNIAKQLNPVVFARCNRYCVVNLRYVDKIEKDIVYIGDDALPISRPQKKQFIKTFIEYMGRGTTGV